MDFPNSSLGVFSNKRSLCTSRTFGNRVVTNMKFACKCGCCCYFGRQSISLATASIFSRYIFGQEWPQYGSKTCSLCSSEPGRLVGSSSWVKGKARLYPQGPGGIPLGALLALSRSNVANNRASGSQAVFTTIFPEV